MNFHNTIPAIVICIAIGTSMAITACAVGDKLQNNSTRADDSTITTDVKARFLDSARVDGRAIHVQTLDGVVLLTGIAISHIEKTRASEIALGVKGVRVVQNEITVQQ